MDNLEQLHTILNSTVSLLRNYDNTDKRIKHLLNISNRLSKNSRIMVVGDLNSGKSTLVNALSRVKIVPMDQQPCTGIFIEIHNSNNNEIHAINSLLDYSIMDSTTFTVHRLQDMEELNCRQDLFLKVLHSDLKGIFTKLHDISIIDSPGLNIDSWTTMKLVQQHEEIDVLVYVISAENHLTLSGKEFLEMAVKEKLHIFIIINRFDQISRKEKCKMEILRQIQEILPNTYSIGQDLIHFISAKQVLDAYTLDLDLADNFSRMEECLVDFLRKRNISKLLPAKTFMENVYKETKSKFKQEIKNLEAQKQALIKEINDNHPKYVKMTLLKAQFMDNVDFKIEEIAKSVQIYSKNSIQELLQDFELLFESVEYEGLIYTWYYAIRLCKLSAHLSHKRINHCLFYSKQECIKSIQPVFSSTLALIPEIPINMDLLLIDETLTSRDITIPEITIDIHDFLAFDQIGSIFLPIIGIIGTGIYTLKDTFRNSIIYSGSSLKSFAVSVSVAGVGMILFLAFRDMKGRLQRKIREKISVEYGQSRFIEDTAENIAIKTRKVLRLSLWTLQEHYNISYTQNSRLLESLKERHTKVQKDLDLCKNYITEISELEKTLESVNLDVDY